MKTIEPGATIGIMGGGQLGRMLGMAAAQLGYRIHVFAPESGPANDVASAFTEASYDDVPALRRFAQACDVVTYEFENVDPHAVAGMMQYVPVCPGHLSLNIANYRPNEKEWAVRSGGRTAPYRVVTDRESLAVAVAHIGTPAILKTASLGYDGKGQARLGTPDDAEAAWRAVGEVECVLEGVVEFTHEFSVILARRHGGAIVSYPPPWNEHRDGILVRSSVPAPPEIARHTAEATALAADLAERMGHVGILTCEFFATADGPVFNEMAPRVHNSGHWTIEGAETSQFENHIRAICGLPLGSTALTGKRAEMENLIGEDAGRWEELLSEPGAHLHLYGKHEARPGRKMGHVTRVTR